MERKEYVILYYYKIPMNVPKEFKKLKSYYAWTLGLFLPSPNHGPFRTAHRAQGSNPKSRTATWQPSLSFTCKIKQVLMKKKQEKLKKLLLEEKGQPLFSYRGPRTYPRRQVNACKTHSSKQHPQTTFPYNTTPAISKQVILWREYLCFKKETNVLIKSTVMILKRRIYLQHENKREFLPKFSYSKYHQNKLSSKHTKELQRGDSLHNRISPFIDSRVQHMYCPTNSQSMWTKSQKNADLISAISQQIAATAYIYVFPLQYLFPFTTHHFKISFFLPHKSQPRVESEYRLLCLSKTIRSGSFFFPTTSHKESGSTYSPLYLIFTHLEHHNMIIWEITLSCIEHKAQA